ncbi:MAG TPA: hypothetical protein VGZ29_13580 [Terriglobia bacterium]|nr:hypothetical protein [Terriglobia bacterium]
MKHIDTEQLILCYYGEPPAAGDPTVARAAIEAHLAVCDRCRAARGVLARTLAAVSSVPVPERAGSYGQEVWQRLEPRLKGSGAGILPAENAGWKPAPQVKLRSRWLEAFTWQRWALGGALATLLVAAFLAGRFWPRPQLPAPAAPVSAQARDRVLLSAVADHMERSEILLMELENAGEGGGKEIDISWQREQAQELAAGSRLYEQAAQQAGETGIANLLDDLNRVLITVAHSPSKVSRTELTDLRSRIEGPGILFKLQVVNSGIEQRLRPAPERPGPGNVQD